MKKHPEENSQSQRSNIYSNSTHVLAGFIKCKCCDGAVRQLSGKVGGHYGCCNSQRKMCTNKLRIPKNQIKAIIESDLKEKFLTTQNLKSIILTVEKLVAKTFYEIPAYLKQKKQQFYKIQVEIQNLLNFIKMGNFSKAVSETLLGGVKSNIEMQSSKHQKMNVFKAIPKEWIKPELKIFFNTLNKNPKAVALALKNLLGTIELEPVQGECVVENGEIIENRSYYVAHTSIQTLALLEEETKGVNWLKWRTRQGPIRTESLLSVKIKIPLNETIPIYQKLASKIKELKVLGMSHEEIASKLKINKKTVSKALNAI